MLLGNAPSARESMYQNYFLDTKPEPMPPAPKLEPSDMILPQLEDTFESYVANLKNAEDAHVALKAVEDEIASLIKKIDFYNELDNRQGIIASIGKGLFGVAYKAMNGEETNPKAELKKFKKEEKKFNLLKDLIEDHIKKLSVPQKYELSDVQIEAQTASSIERLRVSRRNEQKLIGKLKSTFNIADADVSAMIAQAEGRTNQAEGIIKHAKKEKDVDLSDDQVRTVTRMLIDLIDTQKQIAKLDFQIYKPVLDEQEQQTVAAQKPTKKERPVSSASDLQSYLVDQEAAKSVAGFMDTIESLRDKSSFLTSDIITILSATGQYENREQGDQIATRLEKLQEQVLNLQDRYTELELKVNEAGKEMLRGLMKKAVQAFNKAQSMHLNSESYFREQRRQPMGFVGSIAPRSARTMRPMEQALKMPTARESITVPEVFKMEIEHLDQAEAKLGALLQSPTGLDLSAEDMQAVKTHLEQVRASVDDIGRAPLENHPFYQALRARLQSLEKQFRSVTRWKETGILPKKLRRDTMDQVKTMQEAFHVRDEMQEMQTHPEQLNPLAVLGMYSLAQSLRGKVNERTMSDYTEEQISSMQRSVKQALDYSESLFEQDPNLKANGELMRTLSDVMNNTLLPMKNAEYALGLDLDEARKQIEHLATVRHTVLGKVMEDAARIPLAPAAEKMIDATDQAYAQVTKLLEARIERLTAKMGVAPPAEKYVKRGNTQTIESEPSLQEKALAFLGRVRDLDAALSTAEEDLEHIEDELHAFRTSLNEEQKKSLHSLLDQIDKAIDTKVSGIEQADIVDLELKQKQDELKEKFMHAWKEKARGNDEAKKHLRDMLGVPKDATKSVIADRLEGWISRATRKPHASDEIEKYTTYLQAQEQLYLLQRELDMTMEGMELIAREEVDQQSPRFEQASKQPWFSNLVWKVAHTSLERLKTKDKQSYDDALHWLGAKNSYAAAVEFAMQMADARATFPKTISKTLDAVLPLIDPQHVMQMIVEETAGKTPEAAEKLCEKTLLELFPDMKIKEEVYEPEPMRMAA